MLTCVVVNGHQVMDKHVKALAVAHVETKFVKINAEKTPFFVEKLGIKVLPSLVVFVDGKSIDTLIGKHPSRLMVCLIRFLVGFQGLEVQS